MHKEPMKTLNLHDDTGELIFAYDLATGIIALPYEDSDGTLSVRTIHKPDMYVFELVEKLIELHCK